MNFDIVKKIDKNFLEHGSREEFKQAILELLALVQVFPVLKKRVEELEAEVLRMKGEKKSPTSELLKRRA